MKYLFFFLVSLVLLSGKVMAASSKISARSPSKSIVQIKGKSFSIPSLNEIKSIVVPSLKPSPRPAFSGPTVLSLPLLQSGPSLKSPSLQLMTATGSLPPLSRFVVSTPWQSLDSKMALATWTPPRLLPAKPAVNPMDSLSDEDYQLLQAMILVKSPSLTPIALGLTQPLLTLSPLRLSALEVMAKGMTLRGIRRAALNRYNDLLLADTPPLQKNQSLALAVALVKSSDRDFVSEWQALVEKSNLSKGQWGALPLAVARIALDKKDLQRAWNALEAIEQDSDYGPEAQFLQGMIAYRSNHIPEAIKTLTDLLHSEKGATDLRSLTASALAQIQFQTGKYKEAFETYRKVDSSHPLWLESLVESAWSQILNKDYEGAAGNMFSLHTSYFKGAYQPESYIVRTVSYLQLCQYGDAETVLKDFLRKYKFAQQQIASYKKGNPDHLATVREFLRAGSPKSWAGLPRSLLVELGRDPQFIALQKQINELEDDDQKLFKLSAELLAFDQAQQKELILEGQRLKDHEDHMSKTQNPMTRETLLLEKNNIERRIFKSTLLRALVAKAQKGLEREWNDHHLQWAKKKELLKKEQSLVLTAGFQNLEQDLTHWLEQSELLFYEIHSGAGEHLRYQMATTDEAGSKAITKDSKKTTDKNQMWAFDGEIWEDEVGHYRSSLKNVCPDTDQGQETAQTGI